MKLLICDNYKINSYQLPKKIEEFYMINYNNPEESIQETINLVAEDGHWVINSDDALSIKNDGSIIEKAVLDSYTNYQINFGDLEQSIYIQIMPEFESYTKVSIQDVTNITIGSSNSCNIMYSNSRTLFNHATITKNNNILSIKVENSSECIIYVNMKRVKETTLQLGDVIFINGLRIILMDDIILLNNPNQKVLLTGLTVIQTSRSKNENKYTPVTEIERNVKLYKDSELFFHTPRLKTEIKEEIITIEPPPDADNSEQMPMILTLGSSAVFGIISCVTGVSAIHGLVTGETTFFNAILELIMCVLMLISCILFPYLTDLWQKKIRNKNEKRRQERYTQYLNKKIKEIDEIVKKQEITLHENNFTIENICQKINQKDNSIWSREIIDNDFLNVKVGTGNLPPKLKIKTQISQFSLYDDNLKDAVKNITTQKRIMPNVPVTISILKNKITPFIINSEYKQNYIDSIMLQLIFYYSGLDLKIAIFTNETNEENWKYMRYVSHVWNKDKDMRFFASDENEILQISSYLEKEYERRIKDKTQNSDEKKSDNSSNLYKNFSEYYLIITDDFKGVKNIPIINKIINSSSNIGFSLMIIESSLKNLPSRLDKFISIENDIGMTLSRDFDPNNAIQFNPDYPNININDYSRIIANIPISAKSISGEIPTQLSFLDMYQAGRVEHLNVLNRWKNSDPTISLKAKIGMKENNKYQELDLHEKYHGPHGLIAGTTGSGKSEFIITYILSMAINYHPYEVQFILIDYKGGGLAGAFENRDTGVKIPHLVGTITNLDTSEMNRTLVSIKSELKRRQIKFNEARDKLGESTIDIYKYQKYYREGKLEQPISHLFVIADEFAELKEQQPDFMDELVSTARIGRSLGIHLILATQKPSGVVNDQIWSNTRFRVCLKVQDELDSKEMLKRPEAAFLKRAGNFYLQVGNDEIFEQGQSAWAGAKYQPVDRISKKIDDNICFINNNGLVTKTINDEVKKSEVQNMGEQLTNIVKYLYNISLNENIKFSNLWLPSIPANIYLQKLINKYKYQQTSYIVTPIIGEYDKPYNQNQGLYTIDITNKNTIIYGLPGSGKENLLQTLIYSTIIYHAPQEIQFYIMDFGAEILTNFNKTPHVGEVILSDNKNKIKSTFDYLDKQIKKRKNLFSEYSGDYKTYCKNSNSKLPIIVTIINNYDNFKEIYEQYSYDIIPHLLREGSKLGIVFIITTSSTSSVTGNSLESISTKIMMQMANKDDYKYTLGVPLIPKKVFGRGVTTYEEEGCEFQTAYITDKDNINTLISKTNKYLIEQYNNYKAHAIKSLPANIKVKDMLKLSPTIDSIPLGYTIDEVELVRYNFIKNKLTIILGEEIFDNITFVCGIIDLLDSLNIKINLIDFLDCISTDGNINYVNNNFIDIFKEIISNKSNKLTINIILGIGTIKDNLTEEEQNYFNAIMENYNKITYNYFIIIDNSSNFKNITSYSWYNNLDKQNGIWLGENIDNQNIFNINNLIDSEESIASDTAFIIENNNYTIIKSIGDNDE